MTSKHPICPSCGQPILDQAVQALKLSAWETRLVNQLKKAGAIGIAPSDLFDFMYQHDPNGGPLCGIKNLYVRICQLNKGKLKAAGLQIRASDVGRGSHHMYVLKALASQQPNIVRGR